MIHSLRVFEKRILGKIPHLGLLRKQRGAVEDYLR
jgi:hypothetical protein